jgi:hypothetical protein
MTLARGRARDADRDDAKHGTGLRNLSTKLSASSITSYFALSWVAELESWGKSDASEPERLD